MSRKYIIHPGEYAIGENEKLYSNMAAKGWMLDKRGAFLSRFRRAEPAQLRYRIEMASPDTLNGETELPDEQLALYEECGWSYVTGRVWIHIFSAPEGSEAPEIHTDPRQQATALKRWRRGFRFGWIPYIMLLSVQFTLSVAVAGSVESAFKKIANSLQMEWITRTALFLLFALVLIWALYSLVHGAVYTARLHRRLKHGQPIDHAPERTHLLHRIVSGIMLFGCAASAVLSIVQWVQYKKYDMPAEADGPYLLLVDLGVDGERTHMSYTDDTSTVETKHSLLADMWHTHEYVEAGGRSYWMSQDIYELRSEKLADLIIQPLMADAVYTRVISGFKRIDVIGLDEAYKSHMEYIAVKGTTVYFVTYSEPNNNSEQGEPVNVLEILAEAYG